MTYVALLRGINVGRNKRVAMADLRAMLADLGVERPRSLLVSGNLVFEAPRTSPAALERRIQASVPMTFGFDSEIFVRTAAEWRAIVAANPFPEDARRAPGHLLVMCLRRAPDAARVGALQAAITGSERVRAAGRQAYLVFPDGQGRSRLTPAIIERHLGTGTARNWNTVLKLAALAEGRASGVRQ
jgi:uncharacterized protein (DUF1697 family)